MRNLQLFEFGKVYATDSIGQYREEERLCIYLTGQAHEAGWRGKPGIFDIYHGKGIAQAIIQLTGLEGMHFQSSADNASVLEIYVGKQQLGIVTEVDKKKAAAFDIKQTVVFVELNYLSLVQLVSKQKITYKEVNKFQTTVSEFADYLVQAHGEFKTLVATFESYQAAWQTSLDEKMKDIDEQKKALADSKRYKRNKEALNQERSKKIRPDIAASWMFNPC